MVSQRVTVINLSLNNTLYASMLALNAVNPYIFSIIYVYYLTVFFTS